VGFRDFTGLGSPVHGTTRTDQNVSKKKSEEIAGDRWADGALAGAGNRAWLANKNDYHYQEIFLFGQAPDLPL
jgi:hypothetical protein